MKKEDVLKKMAALCLAVYGQKEKIPTNVEQYMLANPLKALGLMMQRHEMPSDNKKVAEIMNDINPDDLDFDKPANAHERGAWQVSLYRVETN